MFWVACVAVPFVAALHHYGVLYGYKGVSRAQALRDAKFTALGTALFFVLPVVMLHLVNAK